MPPKQTGFSSKAGMSHALAILNRVLHHNNTVDMKFDNVKAARSFRFVLYKARTKERKQAAKVSGKDIQEVQTPYDELYFDVVPYPDGSAAIRISKVDMTEFEFICPVSGDKIVLDDVPQAVEDVPVDADQSGVGPYDLTIEEEYNLDDLIPEDHTSEEFSE